MLNSERISKLTKRTSTNPSSRSEKNKSLHEKLDVILKDGTAKQRRSISFCLDELYRLIQPQAQAQTKE